MVSFDDYLLAVASTGVAIYSLWYAYRAWRENRLVADTAVSRIRSAAQGYVQLAGRACRCLGARATPRSAVCNAPGGATTSRTGKAGTTTPSTAARANCPFFSTMTPAGAWWIHAARRSFPTAKIVWYGDSKWPLVRLPNGQGLAGKLIDALMPKGRYRYTEYRLVPEERICVLGAFRTPRDAGVGDLEDAAAALLHDWKKDQNTLLGRFDRDRDGRLSAEEWDEARKSARQEATVARMAAPPGVPRSQRAFPA